MSRKKQESLTGPVRRSRYRKLAKLVTKHKEDVDAFLNFEPSKPAEAPKQTAAPSKASNRSKRLKKAAAKPAKPAPKKAAPYVPPAPIDLSPPKQVEREYEIKKVRPKKVQPVSQYEGQRWVLTTTKTMNPREGSKYEIALLDKGTGEIMPVRVLAKDATKQHREGPLVKAWSKAEKVRMDKWLSQFDGDAVALYVDYESISVFDKNTKEWFRARRGNPKLVVPKLGSYGQLWTYEAGREGHFASPWSWKLKRADIIKAVSLAQRVKATTFDKKRGLDAVKLTQYEVTGKTIGEAVAKIKIDAEFAPNKIWRAIGKVEFVGGKSLDLTPVTFNIATTPRGVKGDMTKAIVAGIRAQGMTFTKPITVAKTSNSEPAMKAMQGLKHVGTQVIKLSVAVVGNQLGKAKKTK